MASVTMKKKASKVRKTSLKRSLYRDVETHKWTFESAPVLCRKIDCFGVKDTGRSIFLGELLDDKMYRYISDSCFYALANVIKNGLLFMRRSNHKKFKIEDFKKGLSGTHDIHDIPSNIIVDDSVKSMLSLL